MSQIWEQLEREIPDEVVASIPVEVFAVSDPDDPATPNLRHAVDDTLAAIEDDVVFEGLPTSTPPLSQPEDVQSQGDTDVDDDVDMDDMGIAHTAVTSELLNLNNRDVCLYEDWTYKHTAADPSSNTVRLPALTLQQIIYDPPELDLKTWRAMLLPRLAIPLKGNITP
uniref:Ecotin n=1 Tax=Ganoderma boninense TaxID=34458 RepID=A0A5K1K3E6_9APHY|nr:Ecotin [Ganoderma boninense]